MEILQFLGLDVRTFAVLPINEECGLIEWVPNTNTIRNVISKQYRMKGVSISSDKLKTWRDKASVDMNNLKDYYINDLLKP